MVVVQVVVRRAGAEHALQEHTFRLQPGGAIAFGRSPDNQVALPDPDKQVSSRHGRIECRADGELYAVDAGSLNGTYYQGQALDGKVGARLDDGATLQFCEFELLVTQTRDTAVEVGSDLDATVSHFDAEDHCERTATDLERLYSEQVQGERTTRFDLLRDQVRRSLAELSPQQATVVLRKLAKRFAATPMAAEGTAADAAPADAMPAEGDAANAIAGGADATGSPAAASLQAMRDLARQLVPGAELRSSADVQRFATLLNQLCESSLRWLAQSLKGRGAFAQEFGAEVTMMFQRSNNPLKALDAEGLAAYLLDWSDATADDARKHYLEAVLKDLAEHQLGVLAGVREAIGNVVARLSPERVHVLAQQQGGWSLSSKAAKSWAAYEQLYAELVEERSKLFHEVISPAIQHGYLNQHGNSPNAGNDPAPSDRDKA